MSDIVLKGKFGFLSLGDIIQQIGSLGSSGILCLTSQYSPEPGLIYFSKGDVVNASTGSLKGLKALYPLFGWTDAEFEFSREAVNIKRVINDNRMALIMDGLRMVDEGSIETLGGSSDQETGDAINTIELPVITGPPADYLYIATEEEFPDGYKIVQENTHGDWIWVILEGFLDIAKDTPQGELKLLKLGEGSFIGGFSSLLFQNTARFTSAIAAQNAQLGILDVQRFAQEFAELSGDFKKILMSLDKRLKEVAEKSVQIFTKKADADEFVKDKNLMIKQGSQTENKFSVITEGEAFVIRNTKSGKIPLCRLSKDDFVGKIPFPEVDMSHEPDTASVFVSENFNAYEPDAEALTKEYAGLSPMLKYMIRNIAACISGISGVACEFKK